MILGKTANHQEFSLDQGATLKEALAVMKSKSIDSLIVTDEDKSVGVLTEKDVRSVLNNQDILKRQEREYLLTQQSKLATMGEMIGHVAHQWRQPLAQLGGVFMNLDAAYEFGELDKSYLKEKVENGNELIKHMSSAIEEFRSFFTSQESKAIFEIVQYVEKANNVISATLLFHGIKIEILTPKEPLNVFGHANEFSHVILNLISNAKDALIRREIRDPKITIKSEREGDYAIISVKENAGGESIDAIDKIFDINFIAKRKTQNGR